MTLDLVVWAPEAFLLISLLVLLWYGSGSLTSPVAERICFLNTNNSVFSAHNKSMVFNNKEHNNSEKYSNRLAGPLHVSGHLNSWAITVCLLMAMLIWETPLHSLQAGGLFLRDVFVSEL